MQCFLDLAGAWRNWELAKEITIRPFAATDARRVEELFVSVNRLLSPAHLREAFEEYIARSLTEEIRRIADYYGERHGGFWVALEGNRIIGTFGLERTAADAMELRRMYVDPSVRRAGVARQMLQYAEDECRWRNIARLELSTSELQREALAFYRNAGFRFLREEIAEETTNKTVGQGLRRYYFAKKL
jgi:GNAT superfamily N-acetyltransferase